MCGITGAVWTNSRQSVSPDVLDAMTDVLRHRGPDGRGTMYRQYDSGIGVGLGHRRLAIIDVEGGRQPLCNEDETVWITFNGEIYNYIELRQDLIARGHQFRTDSDTETIVHLYEEYGTDCLEHLRGMFAFAIWDENQRLLFVARDRLGQKPLVYRQVGGQFTFASEIKSLLQIPEFQRTVDYDALNLYLTFGYVPNPHSVFAEVRKLPPAHFAIYQHGQIKLSRYWEPESSLESSLSVEELREQLREELTQAVRMQLRSDVPLGAFLSGGIDSTTIVSVMQQLLLRPAKTFTMGFPVDAYDERKFAKNAAQHLGTDHCELRVDPASIELLPILTWHFDEPFGDSSAMPTYALALGTSAHVKVALTGDGGDELFAGYPRYRTVNQLSAVDRLPDAVKRLCGGVSNLIPGELGGTSLASRSKLRLSILQQPAATRYLNWVANLSCKLREQLLADGFRKRLSIRPEEILLGAMPLVKQGKVARAFGSQAMMCDLQTYLPDDLLMKVDITSMAHGLECRSPFMDHKVVELAMAIPFRYHLDRQFPKPMLSRTFQKSIPESILSRPKRGFCVPLDHWFRGPLRGLAHDMLLSGPIAERGYFRPDSLSRLLMQHESGKWNHGEKIWILICLEQWHRDFIDSNQTHSQSLERGQQLRELVVASK